MKKLLAFLMLMILVIGLTGCNLVGYDENMDNSQIVAKVNGKDITKGEWKEFRTSLANYYQQYYAQYFGVNSRLTDADIAAYGDAALEQLIQSHVVEDKMEELGIRPLSEEDQKDVESYADSMLSFYKSLLRYQNYPELETVEEEQERLASVETPDEATPKATMTNEELDAKLNQDLEAYGYTREMLIKQRTSEVEENKLREIATKDVAVTDEQVKENFDKRAAEQKESYDATPSGYATAVSNNTDAFYVPEGYRGVKNLLINISSENKSKITELESTISSAKSTLETAQSHLEEDLKEDTSSMSEEEKAAHAEHEDALKKQIDESSAALESATSELEKIRAAAFAEIQDKAAAALARAQSGESFDALIEELGEDPGMRSEPAKTRGYLVCEGLKLYEQPFQDAAMALEKVGDISPLVQTSYGFHILQYAQDIPSGTVEYTDEIREKLHQELLTSAQEAAYNAAITQWVTEADTKTFPNVMK